MENWATKIVEEIIKDLSDRKGLKSEWHNIDEDIQDEICQRWESIIREHAQEKP